MASQFQKFHAGNLGQPGAAASFTIYSGINQGSILERVYFNTLDYINTLSEMNNSRVPPFHAQ